MFVQKNSIENKIIEYLIKNPTFARNFISTYFSFDSAELEKFNGLLNWKNISQNKNIQWNKDMIKTYLELLDWKKFSLMPPFCNAALIDDFIVNIDWGNGQKEGLYNSIANNPHIKWSSNLIERYENYLDFYYLSQSRSVIWTGDLFEKYEERWDWKEITGNFSIPWTLPLFEKYIDFLDLSSSHFVSNYGMSSNLEIVEKYFINFIPYVIFSNTNLPWIENNLLKKWNDKLDWEGLAGNEKLLAKPDFFEQNIEKWLNPKVVSGAFLFLSNSKVLPWSVEFINRFINHWNWNCLSNNPSLPWVDPFIEHYRDKWEWRSFATNCGVPWSVDLINRYEEISCESLLRNSDVWEKAFKPYLNKKMVNTILRLI